MKKTIILFILLVMPICIFAEFQIGPFAAYKFPISSTEDIPGLNQLGLEDFWFGGDARLKASILQGTALVLYMPGNTDTANRLSVNITGGVAFDLAFIRLGLGLGPVWIFSLDNKNDNPIDFGTFIRLNTDFMLGAVSLGLSLGTQLNWTGTGQLFDFNNFSLLAGLNLLFRLG